MLAAAILSFHFASFAEETNVKVPVAEGFAPMNMEGMPPQAPQTSTRKINFSTSCTDMSGRNIQQNQPGYEACLVQAQQRANSSANTNNKPGTQPSPGPQMNMNFNLGN